MFAWPGRASATRFLDMEDLPKSGYCLRMRLRVPAIVSCLSVALAACTSFTKATDDDGAPDGGRSNSGGRSDNAVGGANSGGRRNSGGAMSGGANSDGGKSGSGGTRESDGGSSSSASVAKDVAQRLGREHFLIGMGNDVGEDAIGAFTLSKTIDVHYIYLAGLRGQGGWPDWNQDENGDGAYATFAALESTSRGVVPMFTLYSMAASGEGSVAALTSDSHMKAYWEGARLLYERLDALGTPAIVHLEPDFWGFMQQAGSPQDQAVIVTAHAPECAELSNDLRGMGQCLVLLARTHAPQTLVGFHASPWADPNPDSVAQYLVEIGAGEADLVFTDMLDRDAGCFEAQAPECQRQDGPWYLDETNETSPNFHELQAFAKAITDGTGRPMMWWQVPFGVPSETPGGTAGNYRDNKVKYIFEHIDEFVDAGGVGVAFGVGAGNQTYITTDGGQFDAAISSYYESPFPL